MRGLFITFEGLDGAGKTTQVNLLQKHLASIGRSVFSTREPGGTGVGEKVRAILKESSMAPMTELFLFYASRVEHTERIIIPLLERGEMVICDRFVDSTLAYQVFGRGIERSVIETLNEIAVKNLKPDLTILVDIDAEEANNRAKKRSELDEIEKRKLAFYKDVSTGYRTIATEEPERFLVVDGRESIEAVFNNILKRVARLLGGTE